MISPDDPTDFQPQPGKPAPPLHWLQDDGSDSSGSIPATPKDAPSPESLHDKIPGVEVLKFIGKGGMGWVYQARQLQPERLVALKIQREDRHISQAERKRFENEALIMAEINAPGLVTCFACGQTISDGRFYFIMEWVEGCTLEDLLRDRQRTDKGPLPLNDALDLVIPAGKSLAIAHSKGIIHLDVKPGNIMRTLTNEVKVLDLGLAVRRGPDGAFLQQFLGGSHGFAAPEQMSGGSEKPDARTDVYGLAATLYALITGRPPTGYFEPASVFAHVDSTFDDLLKNALHTTMAKRPASMGTFVARLEAFRNGTVATATKSIVQMRAPRDDSLTEEVIETMAGPILQGCGGASLVSKEHGVVTARCATPSAAAALGLRWLRAIPKARIGIACCTDDQASENSAVRLAVLATSGQMLVNRLVLDSVRTAGLRDPGVEPPCPPLFHLHGIYTWPSSSIPVDEIVGQIHPKGVSTRDPFKPPANPLGGRPRLDPDSGWFAGSQLASDTVVEQSGGWVLSEKLGQGGYGEVWLARHPSELVPTAFKFCHDASRLEAFRREWEIREHLAETLPKESFAFVRIHGCQFGQAPFWLRMDYYPLGSLAHWLAGLNGAAPPPLDSRLQVLARAAAALSLAHSVGVVHRDLKPSNILMFEGPEPSVCYPLLADFGLSGIEGPSASAESGEKISVTQTNLLKAGNRLFAAPEAVTSEKSDVYALGVILYQMVTGQFGQRPEEGWKDHIHDPVLRADIASAIHQDPGRRISAAELSENLRNLVQRQADWSRRKLVRRIRLISLATLGLLSISTVLALALASVVIQRNQIKHEASLAAERAKAEAIKMSRTINSLSPYLDYSKVAMTPQLGVEQFKSLAQALVDSYWMEKDAKSETSLATLKSRVKFQTGVSSMLPMSRNKDSAKLELALFESTLDACHRALEKVPADEEFSHRMVETFVALSMLVKDAPGMDCTRAYAYLSEALDAALRMHKSLSADKDDTLNLLMIYDAFAKHELDQGRREHAAKLWRECAQAAQIAAEGTGVLADDKELYLHYIKIAEQGWKKAAVTLQ